MIVEAGNPKLDNAYFLWQISDVCQYKCSYCTVRNDATVDVRNHKVIDLVLKRLSMYDGDFHVEMYGGEPTTHISLIHAVDELSKMDNCTSIEILTNLKRSLTYFKKLDFDTDKVALTPSYHVEYDEDFLEKTIALHNYYKNTQMVVYVMMSDKEEHWDKTETLLRGLEEHNIEYTTQLLVDGLNYKPKYTRAFFDRFELYLNHKEHYVPYIYEDGARGISHKDIILRGLQQFKGYSCKPLMHEIDVEGNIYNACFKGQNLPMIFKKKDIIKYRTCPNNKCYCDIMFDYHKVIQ